MKKSARAKKTGPSQPAARAVAAGHGHLSGAVHDRIERMVLTGSIAGGERINELRLAHQLKVSRGPIREALRTLERAGLLDAVPNRGMFVRKVALEDALHLYDVRGGLGRTAATLAARRITKPQLARLRATLDRMERAHAARDVAGYYAVNLAFHSQIIECAGNPRLVAVSDAVRNELQLYLRNAVLGHGRLAESQAEHRTIFKAIAEGDAERAGAAFEAHILAGKQRMLDHLGIVGHAAIVTGRAP